jgi:flavocytochrome c
LFYLVSVDLSFFFTCELDKMAAVFPATQTIVVGGGLAGMSAANQTLEMGGKTVLLDKSSFCGGNSTKATSGINGAGTKAQAAKGIPDNFEIFFADTLKGGAKKPEIAKVLCANSGADVDWLVDHFDLDLSLLARLGGHSQPRTHRGAERFPGMTITYALIQMCEKVAEKTDRARIINKAKVVDVIMNGKACVGAIYEKAGERLKEFGPVIWCSGGFGADFGEDSLLAMYRPDLLHLPTTNGEHCTGDGIKIGENHGAGTIDLEWVQVHPTGLVKPDEADAKVKFLAAEALRGVGGIVIDRNGKRFANELGRRDYVTGEMWKNAPPFRLCLNKAASDEIIWHCKHYTGRGVMKQYSSGAELAKDMGVDLSVLVETHRIHYEASVKQAEDPEGGAWPAYPSGKTHDEPSGKTGSGKKFYHNVLHPDKFASEPFFVAIITPVIHYCMGGLQITEDGEVCHSDTKFQMVEEWFTGREGVIPGMYAAGEIAGGVHGNNRLGGNSLLDCVVFGRVCAKAAVKHIYGEDNKWRPCPVPASLKALVA